MAVVFECKYKSKCKDNTKCKSCTRANRCKTCVNKSFCSRLKKFTTYGGCKPCL